jgi:hypothetical protein
VVHAAMGESTLTPHGAISGLMGEARGPGMTSVAMRPIQWPHFLLYTTKGRRCTTSACSMVPAVNATKCGRLKDRGQHSG